MAGICLILHSRFSVVLIIIITADNNDNSTSASFFFLLWLLPLLLLMTWRIKSFVLRCCQRVGVCAYLHYARILCRNGVIITLLSFLASKQKLIVRTQPPKIFYATYVRRYLWRSLSRHRWWDFWTMLKRKQFWQFLPCLCVNHYKIRLIWWLWLISI